MSKNWTLINNKTIIKLDLTSFLVMRKFLKMLSARNIKKRLSWFQKLSGYEKRVNESNYMSFLSWISHYWKKCNRIWINLNVLLKKKLETEPVCNEKYLKTEMKFDKGKLNTNFQANEISREWSRCICLASNNNWFWLYRW